MAQIFIDIYSTQHRRVKTTACISRNDIERLADPIIGQYKHTFVPARHLCYTVDPAQLAALLGYQIEYVRITKDGSILGQTSSGNIWTTIYDANMNEVLFLLDGRTILIEERLLATPRIIGRKNFTIAHKLAHQIINRQFPKMYGPQNRTFCDYRRSSKPVTDWYEWQADALAAALLLPPDAVRDGLFICGLGEKMHLMPPAPNSVGRVKTDIIKPQKARLCDWIDHTVS